MMVDKTENLVSKPPLQVPIVDSTGFLSRAWSVWFRDLFRRVAYKGGNSIDDNVADIDELIEAVKNNIIAIEKNKEDIEANAESIQENAEAIIVNAAAIAENILNIESNTQNIASLSSSLSLHITSNSAHGSNGDIVGFNDTANESVYGLVLRMPLIAEAVDSSVNITTADIGPAPAAYDQAYTQLVTELTNENKAAINQLAQDVNAAISVLNNLLAESQSSNQMTPP